jgi:hypothetical protein
MCDVFIYVRKTNKMQLYLINLFQLNYPLHVSNKQVHHQEVISVNAEYGISVFLMHLWGCLATNRIRLEVYVYRNIILMMNNYLFETCRE